MTLSIVPFYAAILAAGYLALAGRVIYLRRRFSIDLGAGGNMRLERAIRAQGNFAEYVPLVLLLLAFAEAAGVSAWFMHALCLMLAFGRSLHAFGISHEQENLCYRKIGTVATFTVAIAAILVLLISARL